MVLLNLFRGAHGARLKVCARFLNKDDVSNEESSARSHPHIRFCYITCRQSRCEFTYLGSLVLDLFRTQAGIAIVQYITNKMSGSVGLSPNDLHQTLVVQSLQVQNMSRILLWCTRTCPTGTNLDHTWMRLHLSSMLSKALFASSCLACFVRELPWLFARFFSITSSHSLQSSFSSGNHCSCISSRSRSIPAPLQGFQCTPKLTILTSCSIHIVLSLL